MYLSTILAAFVLAFEIGRATPAGAATTTAANSASSAPVVATTTLSSVAQASGVLESLFANPATSENLVDALVENGLTTVNLSAAIDLVKTPLSGEDSTANNNSMVPQSPVYPKASCGDAPYDLSEEQLRGAIYIPPTFSYGAQGQPVILVPGTGSTGYLSFKGNFIPLLQNSSFADPVWLNVPGFLLGDTQINAEYIAYAINYIHGICGRDVAVVAWSQGNIDAQWAYKYWPSTRSKITDHIALSPDYHGSVLANSSSATPVPPALLQQAYNSKFIQTLRSDGGDAAYVPTTTVYSGRYDEIVEPQQGTNASAYLLNSLHNNITASNNEVQVVCANKSAGSFYTHEGIMYNPLGFALLKDALAHDGPGQASRLDLDKICAQYLSPGLSLEDFQLTEDNILIAGVAEKGAATFLNLTTQEPPIKAYASRQVAWECWD